MEGSEPKKARLVEPQALLVSLARFWLSATLRNQYKLDKGIALL